MAKQTQIFYKSIYLCVYKAVNRRDDEILITKHTASIFIGTDFERMIRNAGITTIIFSGIATELGVESDARDALNRLLSCYSFRCSIIIR